MLERKLAKVLQALFRLETALFPKRCPRNVRDGISLLIEVLLRGDLAAAERMAGEMMETLSGCGVEGPISWRGLEVHGFLTGCSPGTILRSMTSEGWPLHKEVYEHDLKSAYEQVDLSDVPQILFTAGLFQSSRLVEVLCSNISLIVRTAKIKKGISSKSEFLQAWSKQFPTWRSEEKFLYIFPNSKLIQGSPLSPILFNVWATSLHHVSTLHLGDRGRLWAYGDNFYSENIKPPFAHSELIWKTPILLGREGKTLGLSYSLDENLQLTVSANWKPYAKGVNKVLGELP